MRNVISLNDGWRFVHRSDCDPACMPADGTTVALPHTWNAVDGHDGHDILINKAKDWSEGDLFGGNAEHYDRGAYWYYRQFETPCQPLADGRVYVEIPAAGMQATVYVNGQKAGYHEGGFSLFRFDVTDLCAPKDNLLAICVSNEYRTNIYPQHADFTFYGGLYRGVNLISVPEAHFDLMYYGGPGIVVIPMDEDGTAVFDLQSFPKGTDEHHTVFYEIRDAQGTEVASATRPASSPDVALPVADVKRWSPTDPYLYTVRACLLRRNEVVDEVRVRTGFRTFKCDSARGFILNGRPTPLRGVCRHQDRLYQGYALRHEDHVEDARLIKKLGANAIRLAHYQHAQDFYDACDELGFVVWAEIPFITIMNEDPAAHENCVSQMKELIIQNMNHPSICFWGLSNEVLLAGKLSDTLIQHHRELEALVMSLDPTRLTTLAHVAMTPDDCGLHDLTDVEAYNHYFGWYFGSIEDNETWLDSYHAKYPRRCLGISEYGCEGIITYHSSAPESKDYTEEYQALYHEHMVKVFHERPYVWGSFVWNMFDFGAAARNEGGVAGRNNKGLVTMDRKICKDSYYIYKAWWNPEPMVHICAKRYAQRSGESTEIRVYSNQPTVALYVNGDLVDVKGSDKVFVFTAKLREGMNTVLARAGDVTDSTVLEKVEVEPAVYTVPSIAAWRAMRDAWFGETDCEEATDLPGCFSVHDTVSTLIAREDTKLLLATALCIARKMEDPAKVDFNGRFRDMANESAKKVLSGKDETSTRLLACLQRKLQKIAR